MKGYIAYRLPNSETVSVKNGIVISYDSIDELLNDDGFIFNAFDSKTNFFINNLTNCKLEDFIIYDSKNEIHCQNQSDYLTICNTLIHFLQTKSINKAILSRIKQVDSNFDPIELFERLNKTYTNTFNYLISIENIGCWIGATPEVLLEANGSDFKTVSIAGTKTDDNIEWGEKEINEQLIVTDFINKTIKAITTDFTQSKPTTIKAGNVYHLKTSFEGKTDNWTTLIKTLHPTPATCGLPQKDAQQHIESIEKHKREFYTGFLGPFSKNKANLFVNLRCLQYQNKRAYLYLGGGITAQSIAKNEWTETENKGKTLIDLIE